MVYNCVALHHGDNLEVLRDSIATESVDLIYLDPSFNSNAAYNVGSLGESGRDRMRGRTAACSQERSYGQNRFKGWKVLQWCLGSRRRFEGSLQAGFPFVYSVQRSYRAIVLFGFPTSDQ